MIWGRISADWRIGRKSEREEGKSREISEEVGGRKRANGVDLLSKGLDKKSTNQKRMNELALRCMMRLTVDALCTDSAPERETPLLPFPIALVCFGYRATQETGRPLTSGFGSEGLVFASRTRRPGAP